MMLAKNSNGCSVHQMDYVMQQRLKIWKLTSKHQVFEGKNVFIKNRKNWEVLRCADANKKLVAKM